MKLYWLDIETTGLSPERDSVLEIAVVETDLQDPFTALWKEAWVLGWHGDPAGPAVDLKVQEMHRRSGLWEECAATNLSVLDVEYALLARVPAGGPREDMPTLAGSSVHFDLSFLRRHMPTLAPRFSHRLLDVSAVKLFCRALGMPKEHCPRAEAHRAMADVVESMGHAQLCAEWLRSGCGQAEESNIPYAVFKRLNGIYEDSDDSEIAAFVTRLTREATVEESSRFWRSQADKDKDGPR